MRFLLRLLLVFIVISTVLSMIRNVFQPAQPARRRPEPEPEPEPERHKTSAHLVKDPVCGMYIPDDTQFRAKDACFCSDECRKKYLAGV